MNSDAVLRELDGLRALARSLVRGDDAEDLLQEAAVAALAHPPGEDRPARQWLALVLRNRRRMDLRRDRRRRARDEVLAGDASAGAAPGVTAGGFAAPDAALERARTLERVARALVSLDEPFRSTVLARYFEGRSAADIARASGVPPGTVRWRLKSGLDRLRAELDEAEPRWRRALAPLAGAGATAVKTKTTLLWVLVLALVVGAGALGIAVWRGGGEPRGSARGSSGEVARAGSAMLALGSPAAAGAAAAAVEVADPRPGQGRATVEQVALAGGEVSGRVLNWSTGDGIAGAELTLTGDRGAITVRSGAAGAFELAPPAPGRFLLTAASAAGFLPYAPELQHSTVRIDVQRDRAVRGITVFLFPAIDYQGRVIDALGAPVPGAKVRLLGTSTGEQAIEKLETEWTSDRDGRFVFHSADGGVLEAVRGNQRGWARLDRDVAITKQLTIQIGNAPARDATITGRVVDEAGQPVSDVLVRADPEDLARAPDMRSMDAIATVFAVTGSDGGFVLDGLDTGPYHVAAESDERGGTAQSGVRGGTRGVTLVLDAGLAIAGSVSSSDGRAVPAYTLLVLARRGARRELVAARSIVEPAGQFEVRVSAGDYELVAAAAGWAPSAPVAVPAGTKDARLVVSAGAVLRGRVVSTDGGAGVAHARIMRETHNGGASAQPANPGTVTRADGTFELTGLPPGPVSISIGAGGYHPKIEAGMVASDGAALGPIAIALQPIVGDERPTLELVGIGVGLEAGGGSGSGGSGSASDDDALRVTAVFPESGAAAAGIVVGDLVVAVDGAPVAQLGLDGAVARIRGVAGTTVSVTLRRGDKLVQLVVERRKLRT